MDPTAHYDWNCTTEESGFTALSDENNTNRDKIDPPGHYCGLKYIFIILRNIISDFGVLFFRIPKIKKSASEC